MAELHMMVPRLQFDTGRSRTCWYRASVVAVETWLQAL